eukprot:TRINITY_DN8673_c0_g2_i1.p3 TRINITY_DN8673_c0_g2~~TRINITY_DN8673_c0_g2_i1.p3  ORF type:complete len:233 (+),score=80.18 TRINITY_DN8673_c0_g2_i1:88-786(+)
MDSVGHVDSVSPQARQAGPPRAYRGKAARVTLADTPATSDESLEDLAPGVPLEAGALSLNTELAMRKDYADGYQGPCLEWLAVQENYTSFERDDELLFTVDFFDPSPTGGLVRVGLDGDSRLCYSINGVPRRPFQQLIASVGEEDVCLAFPETNEKLILLQSPHAVESLLPALRAACDSAGVTHNIPDDAELAALHVPCDASSFMHSHTRFARQDGARDTGCNMQCTGCALM